MHTPHNAHVKRLLAALIILFVIGFFAKQAFQPKSFGKYGHYRADAIMEEANRPMRLMTNPSCVKCHPYEAGHQMTGLHKTISCEFCHGAYADHIKDGKKIGTLPVKRNAEITTLCLRCHNRAIEARPKQVIKTVVMPDHLRAQKVDEKHSCNQCHYVHAPLKYINHSKKIMGLI
ncbi:MAG: hypothetical protein KQH63_09970 [Desulfobulbaceae bacterium]|nr:hypothetical protein [Desulfobulbaceae bacterium]